MLQHDWGHFHVPISSKGPVGVFLLKEVERKLAVRKILYFEKVFEDIAPDLRDPKA